MLHHNNVQTSVFCLFKSLVFGQVQTFVISTVLQNIMDRSHHTCQMDKDPVLDSKASGFFA